VFDGGENTVEWGGAGFEYLKKVSSSVRLFGAIEASGNEVELITELQLHLTKNASLKINNAAGLTSKATDYAPEVGIMFFF